MDPRSQIEAHSMRRILQILLNAHKYVESEPGVHRLRDSDSKFGFRYGPLDSLSRQLTFFDMKLSPLVALVIREN